MTIRAVCSLIGVPLLALLVACGGGAQPTTATTGGAGDSSGSTAVSTASAATSGGGTPATASAGASKTGAPAAAGEGGTSAETAANASQACPLMTKDEARAILGVDVGEGLERGEPPHEVAPGVTLTTTTCRYSASTGRSVSIGFERFTGPGVGEMRAGIRQQFDQSCQKEQVTGVGDVACFADSTHVQLRFLKGTTSVIVGVFQERTDPDRSEALKAQGQKAAARIE